MLDSNRLSFLSRASDVLATSLDYAATLRNIVGIVVPALADWCALYGLGDDDTVERLVIVHANPAKQKIQDELTLRHPMELQAKNPIAEALRTGKSVFLPEMEDGIQRGAARNPEHLELLLKIGFRSGIAAPLRARGRVLGCLGVAITESERRYTREDLELMEELGRRCAFAVDNARLYAEARRAEDSMRFVARASSILASSLDYNVTLRSISRLATPDFADVCIVYVREDDGAIRRVAASHVDPLQERRLADLDHLYPLNPEMTFGVANVLRTAQPEFYPAADEDLLFARGWRREDARLILGLGYRSFILSPMIARGKTLGAISLSRTRSGAYTLADVAVAEDLARRCALAVDNARLFSDLQAADRRKDEFLSMLAHELRNPLGAISSSLAVLQAPNASEEARRRALNVSIRQVRHQARMTDDLLDVSRILRSKIQLHRSRLDLIELVAQTLEDQQHLAREAGVSLSLDRPPGPLIVDADPTRITQALSNLLSNAVKFSKSGGVIRVIVTGLEGAATVAVSDEGEGIDPPLLPHIFDPFVQADRTLDRSRGGLGLGLALVKGLVEQHGGSVGASSAGPGQGATFTISLPLAPPST